MRVLDHLVGALLLLAASVSLARAESFHSKEVDLLTKETFDEKVAQGAWLIKFYSPHCSHCIHFAPTYSAVAENVVSLRAHQFYIGAVNCISDRDLCTKHAIAAYPTMLYFQDGTKVEQVNERDAGKLTQILMQKSEEYDQKRGKTEEEEAPEEEEKPAAAKRKSKSVTALTSADFYSAIATDFYFVKFYAPWCGHCKSLAPIWDELAAADSNNCNFAKVDCTAHSDICGQYNVNGYPTLYMIHGSKTIKYQGSRTFDALESFCNRVAGDPLTTIDSSQGTVERLVAKEPVFFVSFLDSKSPKKYKAILRDVGQENIVVSRFFTTIDSKLAAQLGISSNSDDELFPSLFVVSEGEATRFSGDLGDRQAVSDFVHANHFPALVQMTPDNSIQLLSGDGHVLVLGLLDGNKNQAARKELHQAANKIRKSSEASIVVSGVKKVVLFAWLDASAWGRFIDGVYGSGHIPRVIVQDVGNEEFYDVDGNGEIIKVDAQQISSVLGLIESQSLSSKSIHGFVGALMKGFTRRISLIGSWIMENFVLSAVLFVLGVGFILFTLSQPEKEGVKPSKAE